jgi:S-adenosylmethionine synthetase
MNIFLDKITENKDFEVVERKGIGHPDTLSDGLAEVVSIEYSKYCLENFGAILHHNVDKTNITGGLVDIDFGGGEMLERAKVIVNGRMSTDFANKSIDVIEIQKKAVTNYLNKVLPHFDTDNWLEFISTSVPYSHNPYWYHPRNLDDLPELTFPKCNDTSTCVGYWPLTLGDNLALYLEGWFYIDEFTPKFDYVGQDVKCMVSINGWNIKITMNVPFIPKKTPNVDFYKAKLASIKTDLLDLAYSIAGDSYKIDLQLNGMDNDTKNDYYLLLTGSCIEAGEEGVVGRGNKSRGTINSNKPFSMEAASGKNPVYHVGKVYTAIVDTLSKEISEKFNCEAQVFMTSKIGNHLFDPDNITVRTTESVGFNQIEKIIKDSLQKRDWTSLFVQDGLLIPRPQIIKKVTKYEQN